MFNNKFYQTITVIGDVIEVRDDPNAEPSFKVRLLSNDEMDVFTSDPTSFEVVANLNGLSEDRFPTPQRNNGESDARFNIRKYISRHPMVCVQGILSVNDGRVRLDAKRVILLNSRPDGYAWEDTHWWLTQTITMCDQWLDVLFTDKRTFTANDFSEFYRSNLDILGGHTDDNIQECATLSRFLYGLSSAYMLTGSDRFYSAAKAAAEYLCDTFRSPSHDQSYCFWKFGRRRRIHWSEDIVPSQNGDDLGTFALYEQIYAISGLTQYYRISQDKTVFKYICRTIGAFQDFYHDAKREGDSCFTGAGGYFSHLDYVTMRPDANVLRRDGIYDNRMKKNWNSIGDHIPAYLVNLLLCIDPLPEHTEEWLKLRKLCRGILDECVDNIINHIVGDDYPNRADKSDYVMERFHANWEPDTKWGWQQNRAVVGHNYKIAWNLTRCGHYYDFLATNFKNDGFEEESKKYTARANRCYEKAKALGERMTEVGLDRARGGIYDSVERNPHNGMPTEFVWGNTKDFWQQEQAILAYLILHSIDYPDPEKSPFLRNGRFCCAFWNLFFLDRDNRKIRFRTTESGQPFIEGAYAQQAGHAVAGYHAFELNYLAHIYMRVFVSKVGSADDNFVLFFQPDFKGMKSINVLPDFARADEVEIVSIKIDGVPSKDFEKGSFRIPLDSAPAGAAILEVEFRPSKRPGAESVASIEAKRPHAT
jgi:hypothetical protein